MKTYHYVKRSNLVYVKIYREVTTPERCDMCCSTADFLNDTERIPDIVHRQMDPLCRANHKRHLKSGKHWEYVSFYETVRRAK